MARPFFLAEKQKYIALLHQSGVVDFQRKVHVKKLRSFSAQQHSVKKYFEIIRNRADCCVD